MAAKPGCSKATASRRHGCRAEIHSKPDISPRPSVTLELTDWKRPEVSDEPVGADKQDRRGRPSQDKPKRWGTGSNGAARGAPSPFASRGVPEEADLEAAFHTICATVATGGALSCKPPKRFRSPCPPICARDPRQGRGRPLRQKQRSHSPVADAVRVVWTEPAASTWNRPTSRSGFSFEPGWRSHWRWPSDHKLRRHGERRFRDRL